MNDRLLRLCLRAYPRALRDSDGETLLDLARELVDAGSSPLREAAGLLGGGVRLRARLAAHELGEAPWREARALLALPLAAALLAVALAGAEHATRGLDWIGWSWALTLAGAIWALAGAATGRRGMVGAGALVLAGMFGLDSVRDLYGSGSRWAVPAGTSYVDLLVMWLPAAILLVVCASAVERRAAGAGRRMAWGAVPGVVLLILTSERTNAAEAILLFGGLAIAGTLVMLGLARRRHDPAQTLAGALVLAAATPPALWLSSGLLPEPSSFGAAAALPLVYFGLTTALVTCAVAGMARLAAR